MRLMSYFSLPVFLIAVLSVCPAFGQTWQDDVGFTQLLNEIGGSLEDGTGLNVVQVEAPLGNGNYMPNTGDSQFSGKTITNGTAGGNTGTSGHSNSVARIFFGNTASISGGISDITVYEAGDFINTTLFRNSSGGDPLAQGFDIANHSWIVPNDDDALLSNINARMDWVIERDNTLMFAGVNNGSGNSTPELWAPSMNSIAVGRTDGNHSRGQTSIYQPGRFKPDIVAPGVNPVNNAQGTSFATPKVSSAAAILREAGMGTNAEQNEVTKAVLFAGATKDEFPDWDRTSTRPIDEVYGFGELNIYNSYMIQAGGEFDGSLSDPTDQIGMQGWDYGVTSVDDMYYEFVVEAGARVTELSAALTWNIDVTDTDPDVGVFDPSLALANLDLRLFDSTGSFLGTELDSSVSTLYNHEHIYYDMDLGPGTYTFVISADAEQDFGFAWRMTAIPEQASATMVIGCAAAMMLRRRRK